MTPKTKYRLIIGGIVLFFVAAILAVFYLAFWYSPVPYQKLAVQFCECTEKPEVLSGAPVLSNDDFRYQPNLDKCVGTDFSYYTNSLSSDDERHYYLELFQEEVSKICPLKMSNVFKPIPRPVPDTLIPTAISN